MHNIAAPDSRGNTKPRTWFCNVSTSNLAAPLVHTDLDILVCAVLRQTWLDVSSIPGGGCRALEIFEFRVLLGDLYVRHRCRRAPLLRRLPLLPQLQKMMLYLTPRWEPWEMCSYFVRSADTVRGV